MKADLRAHLALLNKSVDEMIRLSVSSSVQRTPAFGLYMRPRGMQRASIYFARN